MGRLRRYGVVVVPLYVTMSCVCVCMNLVCMCVAVITQVYVHGLHMTLQENKWSSYVAIL